MKNQHYSYLLMIFLLPAWSMAQYSGQAISQLNGNQINAYFTNTSSMFYDGDEGGFQVPFTPGAPTISTIYAAGLWMGIPGPSSEEGFKISVTNYGSYHDYGVGPLTTEGTPLTDSCCWNFFDQIWKVNRLEILQFIADYDDNQTIDQPIPASILLWPGRNNPNITNENGEPLPDQELAPFFDRNQDGIYNPQMGDYPALDPDSPALIPDEMLWYVIHDQYPHQASGSSPIGVEVQITAFSFSCTDNPVLNRTLFTRHKIINKSGTTLQNLKIGYWHDMDLGCFTDDYIGCDTLLNTLYAYNMDAVDGTTGCNCEQGVRTYCDQPPVQAATFLNQELSSLIYYNNASVGSPETTLVGPLSYYNFLYGRWSDTIPITVGGTGYNPGSTDTTLFAFPDNPNDENGWSMYAENLPFGDRRSIMAVPSVTLPYQESVVIDMAYSFHQDPAQDFLGNVNVMEQEIPQIQSFYEGGFSSSCNQLQPCPDDCVWPGDANNNLLVEKDDYLAVGVLWGQQASGPARVLPYTQWFPQNATDWAGALEDGTNQKHADCNGDGVVNELDEYLVSSHYTFEAPGAGSIIDVEAPLDSNGICLTHNRHTISTTSVPLGRLLRATVSLGTELHPIEDIYGISFTMLYDPVLLQPMENWTLFNYEDEFFNSGTIIKHVIMHPEQHRVDFSFCRTDGQNINSFGNLGILNLQVKSDGITANPAGIDTVRLKIVNVKAIDANENPIDIGYKPDETTITDLLITDIQDVANPLSGVKIFPNPSSGLVHFRLPANDLEFPVRVTLFNLVGQPVATQVIRQKTEQWSWNIPTQVGNGLYYLQLQSHDRQNISHSFLLNR